MRQAMLRAILFAAIAPLQAVAQSPVPPADQSAALRAIDPADAVLVLVDFTDGLFPIVETIEVDEMLNNAVAAGKIAKTFGLPILDLGDQGGFYGTMHPAIKSFVEAGDKVHNRMTPSAWDSGTFRAALEATGRRQVVIGGSPPTTAPSSHRSTCCAKATRSTS